MGRDTLCHENLKLGDFLWESVYFNEVILEVRPKLSKTELEDCRKAYFRNSEQKKTRVNALVGRAWQVERFERLIIVEILRMPIGKLLPRVRCNFSAL